jgi:type II secretory pathway predicted ATPase ExeA
MAMYRQLYQLSRDPFAKDIPTKDAYLSHDMKECMSRLEYLARTKGLALVVAAPGFGKTFCLRAFAEKQNQNVTKVVYLPMTALTTIEFYRQLASALGLEPKPHKSDMYNAIRDNIDYLNAAKRIHLIVAIDEAQYLNTEVLRDLKMLMNFNYDSRDRFSVVLVGQPSLADLLSRQVHESLRQRIDVNYSFKGISASEAAEYAEAMITSAGGSPSVFDDGAITAAYNGSNGSIRIFGQILSNALAIGAQEGVLSINAEMVMAAANEIAIR